MCVHISHCTQQHTVFWVILYPGSIRPSKRNHIMSKRTNLQLTIQIEIYPLAVLKYINRRVSNCPPERFELMPESMDRAPALHICKSKAAVTLNLSAMLPWTHKTCMMNYATLETKFHMLIILHFVVGTSHHCIGHASTHCSRIQLVGLQVEKLHFRISFCHHTEWHKTGPVTSGSGRIQRETHEANRCVVQKMLSNHLNLQVSTTHLLQNPWVVALMSL